MTRADHLEDQRKLGLDVGEPDRDSIDREPLYTRAGIRAPARRESAKR
jgi:hypothetical protein